MNFRRLAWILFGIFLLVAPVFGEIFYQYRIRSRSSALIEELLARHARDDRPVIEVIRFDSHMAEISASLFEDLNARLARSLGRPSDLDAHGCESNPHPTQAYLAFQPQWEIRVNATFTPFSGVRAG